MMETKLWIALCALLLVNSGSAEPGVDHVPPSSASESGFDGEAAPKASAESLPASSPVPISQGATAPSTNGPGTNPSSRVTSSLSSYTTSPTTEPKKLNDTIVSEAAVPVNNRNLTDQPTSQPPLPPSGSHAPTSHFPPTSTPTIPTHTAPTTPVDKLTATPPTNKSHHVPLPNSTTPSNQPSHPKTDSSTAVLTSEPPKPETTTTAVTQSSSTSSTSSSRKPPYSETHTTSQRTSQPDRHPETSSVAHPKLTVTPPSSPSAQAKARADGPSQLNVGGDTTMVHDSPTLDPLLAGLVSAFIITAVIITLLLFLKLRRRDNRPEFRRLQDLPMDDMMEDTPLSMYSY